MTFRHRSALIVGAGMLVSGSWCPPVPASPMAAPSEVVAEELGIIDFTVTVSLPGPISELVADLSDLPPGNTAVFTASPDHASGTFHWSPEVGSAGGHGVRFVATAGGVTDTALTALDILPGGTSAWCRREFTWTTWRPEDNGLNFDIPFSASDLGGTSTLTVGVTVYNNCPDARSLKPDLVHGLPLPEQVAMIAAASPPIMTWGGNVDGFINCLAGVPIDLIVEARSTTPESSLSLTSDFGSVYPVYSDWWSFNVILAMRDPRVTVPIWSPGQIMVPLSIDVDAVDPDGGPILSLTADLSSLPLSNDAVFTESANHSHGTLTWTPGVADSGDYTVEFRAANRLATAKATAIHVRGFVATGVSVGATTPRFSARVGPNPLTSNSRLQWVTTRSEPVRVRLFDVQGRLVRELLTDPNEGPGEHQLSLGSQDALGRRLRSGVYLYRVEAAEGLLAGRVTVLR